MQKKSFHITGADGHSIPMYAWLPNEPPLCVLHIAHGMAEYAERYETIVAIMVKKVLLCLPMMNRHMARL